MPKVSPAMLSKWVLIALVVIAVIGFIVGRIRRRLRIVADQPTAAPLSWLTGLNAEARLHRRIRAAAQRTLALSQPARMRARRRSDPTQRLARDILDELMLLDERLIALGRKDAAAVHHGIKELRSEFDRLTALIERLETVIAAPEGNFLTVSDAHGIADLERRLALLEPTPDA